jgi:hypothetical protein
MISQADQGFDLVQCKSQGLTLLDEANEPDRLRGIIPVAGREARRFFQKPALLIKTDGLNVDPGFGGYFSNSHNSLLSEYAPCS